MVKNCLVAKVDTPDFSFSRWKKVFVHNYIDLDFDHSNLYNPKLGKPASETLGFVEIKITRSKQASCRITDQGQSINVYKQYMKAVCLLDLHRWTKL